MVNSGIHIRLLDVSWATFVGHVGICLFQNKAAQDAQKKGWNFVGDDILANYYRWNFYTLKKFSFFGPWRMAFPNGLDKMNQPSVHHHGLRVPLIHGLSNMPSKIIKNQPKPTTWLIEYGWYDIFGIRFEASLIHIGNYPPPRFCEQMSPEKWPF